MPKGFSTRSPFCNQLTFRYISMGRGSTFFVSKGVNLDNLQLFLKTIGTSYFHPTALRIWETPWQNWRKRIFFLSEAILFVKNYRPIRSSTLSKEYTQSCTTAPIRECVPHWHYGNTFYSLCCWLDALHKQEKPFLGVQQLSLKSLLIVLRLFVHVSLMFCASFLVSFYFF